MRRSRPVITAPGIGTAPGAGTVPVDRERDRLAAVIGFGLPVLVLATVPAVQYPYWQWTALALATPVVTWGAWPLHRAALAGLRRGRADAGTLTALAAAVAYGWSVWALVFGGAGSATHTHPLELLAPRTAGSAQIYLEVTVVVVAAALALRRLVDGLPVAADDAGFPPARVAARLGRWYVPATLCLAGATAGFWTGADIGAQAVTAGLAVLAIATPLAVDLAVPVAVAAGLRRAADDDILVPGAAAIATAGAVDTVVLGGALLCGPPAIIATVVPGTDERDAIAVAAALAAHSPDPAAAALAVTAAFAPSISEVTVGPDRLVHATTGARSVSLGPPDAIGLDVPDGLGTPDVVVAWDGLVRAGFTVTTRRHPDAAAAVAALRGLGLIPVLLTAAGDTAARDLADGLAVDVVLPGAAPEGKAEVIRKLQADGHGVVAVVDPHRDADALAAADLGIAVGGPEIGAALDGIGVPAGDPTAAARAIRLARRIVAVSEGSVAAAAGVPLFTLPIAAAGLVHPLLAAVVGPALTVLVVGNGLRLRRA